ncbi:cache domain-containing sensor histidine kinase [Cohnella soli]|uniref:Sensor histidine kinase n=1 Tax=Cohnella soli TaxID=425005 RepID=A0ABW0HU91_9BACL
MKRSIGKRFKRKTSIQTAIMINIFVVVTVLLTIVTYASYAIFSNFLVEQSRNNASMMTKEVMANVDFYFNEVEETIMDASSNPNVQIGVKDKAKISMKYYLSYIREIQNYFNNLTIFKPDIDEIIIVKADGTSLDSARKSVRLDYRFDSAEWFPDVHRTKGQAVFVGPHEQQYYYDSNAAATETVSAVAPIRDIYRKDSIIGSIVVNLNMSKIASILNRLSISPNHGVYLLDDKQKLVYKNVGPEQPSFGTEFTDLLRKSTDNGYLIQGSGSARQLLAFSRSEVNGWTLVWNVPLSDVASKLNQFRIIAVILFFAFIPIVWMIAYLISNRITSPVKQLMRQMSGFEKWIGQDHAGPSLPASGYHEIDVLSSRFRHMTGQINELINEAYKLELVHKDSELKALQARINPHFLYNTLQTIKSLSALGKNEEVGKLVTSLGRLFRYTIGNDHYMVALRDELKHLQHYLDIQILWLRHDVEVSFDVDERLHEVKIPRLSLQPIVENCFIHAFKRMDKPCRIGIRVALDDQAVAISIYDNGNGMTQADLAELRRRLAELDTRDEGHHIALLNVHRRLVLKFGPAFGLSIDSIEDEGFSVQIKLPVG